MSNIASAAGFHVRIVSLMSMTSTAAGSASSARWIRAAGAGASATAAAGNVVAGVRFGQHRGGLPRHGGRSLEDAPLQLQRGKEARARQQRFRAAEEENAVLPDRVMEPGQDAVLQLTGEIDQHVAADEQVDVRQWRRL